MDIMNKPRTADDEPDDVTADNLYVTSFSTTGFKLSNLYGVVGPCVIFPRTILSWNVASAKDITPESLTLFSLLEPRLDVLIIGIGDGRCKPDAQRIITFCRRLGINVEILNTEEACATFNFLNGERRHVAAALIPPESVSLVHPEFYLADDDYSGMQGDVPLIEMSHPEDPTHPRNWYYNPEGVLRDNAIDYEMSNNRREVVNKRQADEIRFTEAKIKEEVDAMEDRYTKDGAKVVTELEKEAKLSLEKDYVEYEKTGVMSDRLKLEMTFAEQKKKTVRDVPAMVEAVEEYRTEAWGDLDKSKRFQKKFEKLYDVGQDEKEEEAKEVEGKAEGSSNASETTRELDAGEQKDTKDKT